ncbi:MAG: YitT family protein, partial [Oscillospiraceae bacterium]|nr:YitT family protein [Oscillospiraceae bacterium]
MAEACSAILAGNMLLGFAVAAFILPSGVIMGGATGVGIV